MKLTYAQGITILQAMDFKRMQVGLDIDERAVHEGICAYVDEDLAGKIDKEY